MTLTPGSSCERTGRSSRRALTTPPWRWTSNDGSPSSPAGCGGFQGGRTRKRSSSAPTIPRAGSCAGRISSPAPACASVRLKTSSWTADASSRSAPGPPRGWCARTTPGTETCSGPTSLLRSEGFGSTHSMPRVHWRLRWLAAGSSSEAPGQRQRRRRPDLADVRLQVGQVD
jgi:hypothetical protein